MHRVIFLPHIEETLGCKRLYCVTVFQGGYNLSSLPQSVCQTVQTLLGDPAPSPANLEGPCERSVRFMCLTFILCVFYESDEFIFLFSAHLSPFSVSDRPTGGTGPASNMQVQNAKLTLKLYTVHRLFIHLFIILI